MTDIASLGIKITTDGAAKAQADLDAVAASGAQAEAAAGGIGKAWQGASAQVAAGSATISKSAAQSSAAINSQMRDLGLLDAITGKRKITLEQSIAVEEAMNRLRAQNMLSSAAEAEVIATLDSATLVNTKLVQANTVANVENAAAKTLNARTSRELGTILSEVASGRVGNARRSLGALANSTGLLAKVFTPLGIAITGSVAAIAALGVVTLKSEKQAEEFNKALVETGRFGAATGATLQGIAGQVGVLTGSYSGAADAVMALTRAGKGLDSNLTGLATTVTNISAITGEAIDKVANNLVELEKDPVAAITKTTSLMGLLTTAQFKEIAALQETQGPAAAAALAIKDIGTAAEQTSKQLDDNSGYILQFLHSVESFGSRSLFLLENVGSKAISTQIAVLQAQKQNLQDTLSSQAADIIPGYAAVIRKSISQADAQIAQLQARQKSQAMFQAGQDLAAQSKLKLEQAYNALGQNELKTADNLQATYKAINDQRRMALALATTQGQRDTINANANQKILDATKKYNEQFAGGGGAVRTPRAPKDNSDKARQQALDELRQEVQWQGKLDDATQAYQNSLDDMLATRKQQIALQVESVGMGQKEFAQKKELLQIDSEYNRQLASLNKSYEQEATTLAANGQLDRLAEAKKAYEDKKTALKQSYDDLTKITEQGFEDQAAAQSNGLLGMQAAMKDFVDAQNNYAKQAYDFTTKFANGFSDAFASFASGTESAKKAFGSFIDALYQDALKFLANQAISKLFGMLGGTHQETFDASSLSSGFNIGGSSGGGGFWSSLIGAVFGGGRASGGPVSAGALYRVNEDGPELLNVGNQSYLMMGNQGGSVTPNGASRGSVTVNQTVFVQGLSSRRTREQLAQETARVQRTAVARG